MKLNSFAGFKTLIKKPQLTDNSDHPRYNIRSNAYPDNAHKEGQGVHSSSSATIGDGEPKTDLNWNSEHPPNSTPDTIRPYTRSGLFCEQYIST